MKKDYVIYVDESKFKRKFIYKNECKICSGMKNILQNEYSSLISLFDSIGDANRIDTCNHPTIVKDGSTYILWGDYLSPSYPPYWQMVNRTNQVEICKGFHLFDLNKFSVCEASCRCKKELLIVPNYVGKLFS